MARIRRTNVADLSQDVPISRFIPNALTILGLCSGATAIWFALSGHWKAAVAAIVFAAIFDSLDGRVARLIGAGSDFGAQLDSLSDLVSFGIAPSMLVYMWTLYHAGGAGWTLVLVFCVCCAIRLARFNIESADKDDAAPSRFSGVPTPAAACLILLPMQLSFQFNDPVLRDPAVTGAMIAIVSLLMVSRIPTFSLKGLRVPQQFRGPVATFAGLLLGFGILRPWATLTACLIVYLGSIPFGAMRHADEEEEDDPLLPPSDE
jgi:CDP-diacylglycerol---serine O-phosphatidyltransferase